MSGEKAVVLVVFIICYALALSRKIKIAYASLGASALLLLLGLVSPQDVISEAIKWDVLGIYWGFMVLSLVFLESGAPDLLANRLLVRIKKEKYMLLVLCTITAFLSSLMENVGVVLMMAPVAIAVARRMNSSLFPYLVGIAISSNVATTVTMIADPPPIILAMETGMKPLDFYWFLGRPGLGTLSIVGVSTALLSLLLIFRKLNKTSEIQPQRINVTWGAPILFITGIFLLMVGPEVNLRPGLIGLGVGAVALALGRQKLREIIVKFDWNSFLFIVGIFVVVYAVNIHGLLADFAGLIVDAGIRSPSLMLALIIWISVAFSSFIDNVPYTVLMIPVCQHLASLLGISSWPLLYGMIVGTGMGGNITPVGASANVFATGILEKHGYKIRLLEFMKIGVPFTIAAVLPTHLLLQIFWL